MRKLDYRWGPPDFKIYPSGLSFTMCPTEYIKGLEKWNGIENLDAIYRVKRGSAVHKEFQTDLLNSKSLYKPPENIDDPRIITKLSAGWPEVPFHSHVTGISGSCDCVLSFKGQPLPTELKSTSIEKERWKTYKNSLPMPNHICQVSIYCHHFLALNYYPGDLIDKMLIVYINLLYLPGDQEAEHEILLDYDHEKTDLLVTHLSQARIAYMNKEELACTYPECRSHG